MKLEVIIIKLALVRLAPWPRPSTNRLINRLINRLLPLFALHRPLYTLYALLTFPASADVLPVFYNYHPTATRGEYTYLPHASCLSCRSA